MALRFEIVNEKDILLVKITGRIISDEMLNENLELIQQNLNSNTFQAVVCDCSKLEYINSSGLNFFVRTLTRARNHSIDCLLLGLQPAVAKLFEISKLDEVFCVLSSMDEVKQKLIDK
jgi:anti-sigma B factor antagonist